MNRHIRFEEALGLLDADHSIHGGRNLRAHLVGTAELLSAWGCCDHVCAAGMFHSIYGTNAFRAVQLKHPERRWLRALIGRQAERLVYLFSICERPEALLNDESTLLLVNRKSGRNVKVSKQELQDLRTIECANLFEQGGGATFFDALEEMSRGRRRAVLDTNVRNGIHAFLHNLRTKNMCAATLATKDSENADAFDSNGYTIYRGLMPPEFLEIAFRYYMSYVGTQGYYDVREGNNALDRYVDALGEAMMPKVQERIEQLVGRRLLPTYSFARIYTTESRLTKHIDRGSCEISATMTVGYKNAVGLWPIFVESNGAETPVYLDAGDAMIYRGRELPHWREPLPRGIWCQLFFHFVDANGSLIAHEFDGRGRLGPSWPR